MGAINRAPTEIDHLLWRRWHGFGPGFATWQASRRTAPFPLGSGSLAGGAPAIAGRLCTRAGPRRAARTSGADAVRAQPERFRHAGTRRSAAEHRRVAL